MYCRSVRWNCIYLYQKVSKLIFKKNAPRFYQSISIRQERKETKVFLDNFARKGVHWVMPGGCFVEKSKQSDIMITDSEKRCFINRSYMITLEYYYLNIRKRKKTMKFVLLNNKQLRSQESFCLLKYLKISLTFLTAEIILMIDRSLTELLSP